MYFQASGVYIKGVTVLYCVCYVIIPFVYLFKAPMPVY